MVLYQIFEELVFPIRSGEVIVSRVMSIPQIAGVTAVAAPEMFGCALENQYRCPRLPGRHGRTQCGIASADDQNIPYPVEFDFRIT